MTLSVATLCRILTFLPFCHSLMDHATYEPVQIAFSLASLIDVAKQELLFWQIAENQTVHVRVSSYISMKFIYHTSQNFKNQVLYCRGCVIMGDRGALTPTNFENDALGTHKI